MKRYLFLDFDGVINTHRSLYKRLAGYYDVSYTNEDFDEKYWGYEDGINPILKRKIETISKDGEYKPVKKYQEENNTKVESICILDDEASIDIDYMLGDYTVKDISTTKHGLREEHIKEAKEIFNKPFNLDNIKV
jgi:hypothetical protein